ELWGLFSSLSLSLDMCIRLLHMECDPRLTVAYITRKAKAGSTLKGMVDKVKMICKKEWNISVTLVRQKHLFSSGDHFFDLAPPKMNGLVLDNTNGRPRSHLISS
ncbi:hypothetical protein Ancab_010348, partial [Ancistrocladus abbreviatus]